VIWDLHVHTNYCDGNHSPEEMILSAIEHKMDVIGLCTHSYTPFDERYCIAKDRIAVFQDEVHALAHKYAKRIRVLCGVEQDILSDHADGFDYVIGSVHYVPVQGGYVPVDESPQLLLEGVQRHFGGDIYNFVQAYYALVGQVVETTDPLVIGHFDLVTKFNEKYSLIDPAHPRYVEAAMAALDRLTGTGRMFEVNTGAISRGYRTTPYPSPELLAEIARRGNKICLSRDSHSKDSLMCSFDAAEALLQKLKITACTLPI